MNLDEHEYCYVTTKGRVTGRPHTIEIWYCARERTAYILVGDGEGSDTVKNLRADPSVVVKIGDEAWRATGRVVADDEETRFVRERIPAKYAQREEGLEAWATEALPVAFDLQA